MPKRLVIFVEGKGDVKAAPVLAQRVVTEIGANDVLFVDHEPFRVRGLATLVKNDCSDWHRWLNAARKTRANLGAVILMLDGDPAQVPKSWKRYESLFGSNTFCARYAASALAEESRSSRVGNQYSLATVFAMKEFETWLLGGVESLRGKPLADGRGTVPTNVVCPNIDLENKRDAKGQLKRIIPGYDQSLDQIVLAREVDLAAVRNRCRSFRRFCSAVQQLSDAIRSGVCVVTPSISQK